jgi:hypothetical protein
MRGVRLGGISLKPALVVKIDDQLRIAFQRFGRANISYFMPFPQTARIAESQQTAVGADARAGQHDTFFLHIAAPSGRLNRISDGLKPFPYQSSG